MPAKIAKENQLTQIHCKVTKKDKIDMDRLTHRLGINTSDAIRMFIRKTLLNKGIPFPVTTRKPSSLDQAVNEIKVGDGHKSANLNDLKAWLNK